MKSYIEKLSPIHEYELEIKESKKRKTRKALMEIRFGIVELCRPEQLDSFERYLTPLKLNVVQIKEKSQTVPKNETPVEWMLYTSLEVTNEEQALKIINYYKCR